MATQEQLRERAEFVRTHGTLLGKYLSVGEARFRVWWRQTSQQGDLDEYCDLLNRWIGQHLMVRGDAVSECKVSSHAECFPGHFALV